MAAEICFTGPVAIAAMQARLDRRTRAAKRVRSAEVSLIPGLLQTSGYAGSIIAQVAAGCGTSGIDAAVQGRMRRQDVLRDQSKVFEFAITEAALRLLPCPPQVMLGQLGRLMSLEQDNVTLGIIPFGTELPFMPFGGFLLLDDDLTVETYLRAETLAAEDDEPAGDKAAAHHRIFGQLMGEAVTGDGARRLIAAAADGLRG